MKCKWTVQVSYYGVQRRAKGGAGSGHELLEAQILLGLLMIRPHEPSPFRKPPEQAVALVQSFRTEFR